MANKPDTDFTIVIPTYCEANNIKALIERIAAIDFHDRQYEILVIDDNSQDGIVDIINELKLHYPWLRLIVRYQKPGLSESIVEGFIHASHAMIVIMDADLSHPPEKIPEMLSLLTDNEVDFVIGSRYVAGGSCDPRWSLRRKLTSRFAAFISRKLLSIKVKDPLSGFLAIRKKTLHAGDPLKPIGWKIGLEIMIKCRCKNIREVPIHFAQRNHGSSKLNLKTAIDYLKHVLSLCVYRWVC